jgi:hypothetical protein
MTATALAAVGSNANENGTLLISGTAVTASSTSVDFTGIPSWVKRITVMFSGVSTNGADSYIVQLGSGSVTTSGYLSTATSATASANATNGLLVCNNLTAATFQTGIVTITNITSNTWVSSGVVGVNAGGSAVSCSSGGVSLSGTLDRIRITTVNGTNTFDAGTINLLWE